MKTQMQSSVTTQNGQTVSVDKSKKMAGRKIARLEAQLAHLDKYEDDVKNRMQDRMKFMSGKNAHRNNKELESICRQKEAVRIELSRLQEMV